MTDVTGWNPMADLAARDRYELLSPFIDIRETSSELVVDVELPGMKPEDFDVTVCSDSISIEGETRCEEAPDDTGFHRIERRYGCFRKMMRLPVPVKHEMASADYRDGILTIRIPKVTPGKNSATRLRLQ